ncbi:MAG: DUF5686 family protein [Cyclobacteriaceae bacterium]
MRFKASLLLLLIGLLSDCVFAQQTRVSGKITDANTGDPVPFVNVVFKGTTIGITTDFEGRYNLATATPTDTLVASYVGYKAKRKVVKIGVTQTINFQLEEDVVSLQEVVILAGENPAWSILRNAVDNKNKHDKRNLSAYEYDTYTKIEIDIDNMTEKFREKKIMKKITQVMDSVEQLAGEDGNPVLPLFISESVSKLYFRDNPNLKKEHILKSKITGIGVEDGTLVTQVIGSSFQEYNFYQNWLSILGKEFVSPIADVWRLYYDFDLSDSLMVGGHYCYRLDFIPRSEQELAFTGTIWITKEEFALKQVDVTINKQANLNFIEKIKIQQELEVTSSGHWLPSKNRLLVDIGQINDKAAGMLAKFYTSNRKPVINQPKEPSFYANPILLDERARLNETESAWDTLRHDPLSETEKSVYRMIDTLQNIPVVKTYVDVLKVVLNGYYKTGKFYVGPYLGLVAYNNIEGLRLQGGGYTNMNFSDKWVLGGQLAYGFKDEKIKYSAYIQNILSRDRWTTMTFRVRRDITRIGIDDELLSDNPLFLVATQWGNIRRGYYYDESRFDFKRELFRGFSQRVSMRYWTFNPTYNFGYYEDGSDPSSPVLETFKSAELTLEARYAKDEIFVQNDNDRISLGTVKWPVISLTYTHGFEGLFGSNFEFDKLRLAVSKRIKSGPLGVGYTRITGEYVFNTLPYPMLSLHLGNETSIYTKSVFNLMNFGEFISDRFISLQHRQHMEGFFFNKVPLLKKLKLREVATVNVVYGGMRDANKNLIAPVDSSGDPTLPAGTLIAGKPYVELGYGVENILRFLRVDFIHRMTYLDNPGARSFGVLLSAQFTL